MVTNTSDRVWSDLAIPPGELLAEELDVRGMTQRELAERTGRPEQKISEIVNGKKSITQDTALELEKVLGIPAQFWLNLESSYRLTLAREREKIELEKQLDWLDQFPLRDMERRKLLPFRESKTDKLLELLKFFGVASFSALRENQTVLGYRVTPGSKVKEGALWAWLQAGELAAEVVETQPYDEARFTMSLEAIRALTAEEINEALPRAQALCAEAGVALVVIRQFSGTGANGVARWIAPDKAMIQMSTHRSWMDIFWFSFFHEARHVLDKQRKRVFVNGINDDPASEAEADAYAANFLIPQKKWTEFKSGGLFSSAAVRSFAAQVSIAPAIVVGKLQHEGLIPHSQLDSLRPRLIWNEDH